MRNFLLGLLLALATSISPAQAGDRGGQFQNLDQMIEALNLRPYFQAGVKKKRKLKVAILDNGFREADGEIGGALPENTEIHAPKVKPEGEEEIHGFYMAKIFWSLLSLGGEDDRFAPAEFHLYPTYGYSNFEAAVNDVIDREIDIVLYSQTWEYGGNFDGTGFIDALVDKAVDAGVLWINNAGNFGDTTYNASIKSGTDDWVKLPGRNESVEIRCGEEAAKESKDKKCKLRTVLSWNDFSDDTEEGTDKDLDFVLTDDTLNVIQSASLVQMKDPGKTPGASKYPREIITADLDPGLYLLRVKNRSKNFTGKDKLRITASGDFITMQDYDKNESLLAPADNKGVITVGATDTKKSSLSVKLKKPELYTASLVSITKKENFKGTSNSAAMVAAGAAILFSVDRDLTIKDFLKQVSQSGAGVGQDENRGYGLPLEALGFQPTGGKCFVPVDPSQNLPPQITFALNTFGGTLVETTAGWKIFYNVDPIQFYPGLQRRLPNDIIVQTPMGPGLYHRSALLSLQDNMTEVVQTPYGQTICSGTDKSEEVALPTWGKVFRLPNRK